MDGDVPRAAEWHPVWRHVCQGDGLLAPVRGDGGCFHRLYAGGFCFQALHGHAGAAQVKQGSQSVWRAFCCCQRVIGHGNRGLHA